MTDRESQFKALMLRGLDGDAASWRVLLSDLGGHLRPYFSRRLSQAPRDSDFALAFVKENARTRTEQEACIAAVQFKCNVLWAQLDALHHAYVTPGLIPPGAWRPGDANV